MQTYKIPENLFFSSASKGFLSYTLTVTLTVVFYPDNYSGMKLIGDENTIVIDSAHAGDNFIVVVDTVQANVNNAALGTTEATRYKETDNLTQSELLTVWRTLNVEIDETVDAAGNHAGILSLTGIPTEQYRRACIELMELTQDDTASFNPDVIEITDLSGIHDPLENWEKSAIEEARSTLIASAEYWTVHLVATFFEFDTSNNAENGTFGWAAYNELANTAFVYGTAIENNVTSWNANNPGDTITIDLFRQRTIAHEIGHLFYIEHPAAQGIMTGELDIGERNDAPYLSFNNDELKSLQSVSVLR